MKLKYILCSVALLGAFSACEVTDRLPIDSITDENYWSTVNDLKMYANGLYGNLDAPAVNKDDVSDNFITTNYSTLLFDEQTLPATADDAGWTWTNIRNCNYFLQRYQKVEGVEAEINLYVAEVRFFRALDYYGKIKKFGDVPWYEKDLQTNDTEELYKARDPRDFVLGKVIEDLEFAIQWLPESGTEEKGRLNKDAARTQLARICLYYGSFKKYHNETGDISAEELLQKAVDLTNDVINTGKYAIVKGSDSGCGQMPYEGYPCDYSNQFIQEDLSGNKECILARYYESGVVTHETGRQAGGSGSGLSKDFVESFLCIDGNPISISPLYKGDNIVEQELENRDPRMYQIVDNLHKPYRVINNTQQAITYPDCSANGGVTGYSCVKYRSPLQSQWEARQTTYDWFVYRYAEVLLINAEANAELGKCTQEVLDKTINLLRDRVGMPHMTTSPVADPAAINYGYSVTPLIYEIRRERRIELIQEGHRLDDLKRWNAMKVFENPKTMLGIPITPENIERYAGNIEFGGESGRPTIEYNGKVYLYQYPSKKLDDAGRKWTADDKRWLSPLPTDELVLNTNLKQNPGWGE